MVSAVRVLVVTGMCLAGCASTSDRRDATVLEPAPVSIPQARIARIPAAVAVFYSPEFAQRAVPDRGISAISHRAGGANVALFDRVLDAAFEQVVRLSAWPPPAGAARPEVSLVFVPRIDGTATIQSPKSTALLIDYTIEAYTQAGERVDSWTIHAKSRAQGVSGVGEHGLYPAALRDAAAQLLTSIAERPALKARLPATPAAQAPAPRGEGARGSAVRLTIASLLEPAEAREPGAAGDAGCIADALAHSNLDASLVPLAQIQDPLFPWLEPANLMETARRMLELMRLAPVREGLRDAGVDYVAFVHTERSSERNPEAPRCDTTYKAPGCSGVRADALKTTIQVTLWNLKRYTRSARFETEGLGSATFSGVTVPIAGERASPASACVHAADAIGRLIGGR